MWSEALLFTGQAWNVPPFGEPDNLNPAVHFKDYNEIAKRINIDLDEEVSNVSIVKLINYDGAITIKI
ncbi:Protein of unknown function [Cotesia congregata]|uniref:Uncharacterized protein n=1 Tax=Cotesia congregata TaxID=51543 RepID=A0A8J2HB68_COTCN|nr:Protein of unknown function [Cotesia congregata]